MIVTRRWLVSAAMLSALALTGCSGRDDVADTGTGGTSDAPELSEPEEQKAGVGDAVDVTTEHGDLRVTVDGFETSERLRQEESTFNGMSDGETIGVLKLLVENVSYNDQYNKGSVSLEECMRITGSDGVTINPMSSASEYGQYAAAAGAFFDCDEGEKVRVAVWYQMDASIDEVTVMLHDPRTTVTVQVGRA